MNVASDTLASGLPVVAPASGGLTDVVAHGRTGLLCNPADHDGLHRNVKRLVVDIPLRRELARAARRSVAHRTWASLGDELLSHYATAIETTSQDRAA